jgi:hypothetical protein
MIFAADHWADEKIMKDVYSREPPAQPCGARRSFSGARRKRNPGPYGMFDLENSRHPSKMTRY